MNSKANCHLVFDVSPSNETRPLASSSFSSHLVERRLERGSITIKNATNEIPFWPNLKSPHPPQLEITVLRDEDIAAAATEMMSEMRRSVTIGRPVVTHEASHREALTSPEYDG